MSLPEKPVSQRRGVYAVAYGLGGDSRWPGLDDELRDLVDDSIEHLRERVETEAPLPLTRHEISVMEAKAISDRLRWRFWRCTAAKVQAVLSGDRLDDAALESAILQEAAR